MKSYKKQILLSTAFALIAGVAQAQEVYTWYRPEPRVIEIKRPTPRGLTYVSRCDAEYQRNYLPKGSQFDMTIDMANVSIRGSFEEGDGFLVRNGQVITDINECQAKYACNQLGARLPTARELITEEIKRGTKMLELSQVSKNKVPRGFNFRHLINPDGSIDQFFHNEDDYNIPTGDLGDYWIISSSNYSIYDKDTHYNKLTGYNFRLEGKTYIGYDGYAYSDIAVRCVKSARLD